MAEGKKFEQKSELDLFREEVAELVRKELSGEESSGHFIKSQSGPRVVKDGLNVEELTEDDMRIWEKIKSGAVTPEEFEAYRISAKSTGRTIFSHFFGNAASAIFLERELEARAKAKRNKEK